MDNYQTDPVKANILIVDDTAANLRLLSNIFVEQGYKVRGVLNGQKALSTARLSPPDLILLDIKMPDIDGYEICQQLKADERTCDIPVIFISVLSDVFDKVKAFSVGGVDYITKLFEPEEVVVRVENQLRFRALQKQLALQNARLEQEICDRQAMEEKFAILFRLSPNPVAIATLYDERFIEVNDSFLEFFHYSRQEAIGYTASELNIWVNLENRAKVIQLVQDSGTVRNLGVDLRTHSGEVKTVRLSAERIDLSQQKCLLLIVNDRMQNCGGF